LTEATIFCAPDIIVLVLSWVVAREAAKRPLADGSSFWAAMRPDIDPSQRHSSKSLQISNFV
jgi:hypothetical protein